MVNIYDTYLKRHPIKTVIMTIFLFVIYFEIVTPYLSSFSTFLRDILNLTGGLIAIILGIRIVNLQVIKKGDD